MITLFKIYSAGRRITCLLSLLTLAITAKGQNISLSREVVIDLPGVQPQTGNYYDISLRDTFLNILFHNPENGKSEIWIEKENGFDKRGIIFPDSIEVFGHMGAFDINDKYFCYADLGYIYIGDSKDFRLLKCISNFQHQHRVATNLHLKGDTIIFSSYETAGSNDKFKSYAVKYHIPSNRFFDTVFMPLKNTYYNNFNQIEPIGANEKFIAFSEPHEYNIKVMGWHSKDTLSLTRQEMKYLWKPIRQDSVEILFTDDIDHLGKSQREIERKTKQVSFYAFNYSNISKLFFVNENMLLVRHTHPHAKMSYADLWYVSDTSAFLLKKDIKFTELTAIYDYKNARYTFIPEIMSACAFYSGNGKIALLASNIFRKDYQTDKLIIQVFDVK